MFSAIKRIFGNITVHAERDIVHVEGVDAYAMTHGLDLIWGSRINNHMFLRIDRSSFSFYSFFLPDILYSLEGLTRTSSLRISIKTLNNIKEALVQCTWLVKSTMIPPSKLNYDKLKLFDFKPLDFQTGFFEAYDKLTQQYSLNGFLLAGAAGSGKSLCALYTAEMLEPDRVIIVCPKNALERVWESTIEKRLLKQPTYWSSASNTPYKGAEKYIIVHYEYIEKLFSYVKKLGDKKVVVILDESHNLNEIKSARTNLFIDLCRTVKSKNVIWLSGTPIKALSIEAIPLLRCIDPLFTPEVEIRFKKIYAGSINRATEILGNRLGLVSYKVEKHQLGLLDPIFKEVKVTIPNGHDYTLTTIKKAMTKFIDERHVYYRARKDNDVQFYSECLGIYEKTISTDNEKEEYSNYKKCVELIKKTGAVNVPNEMLLCNRFEMSIVAPTLPKEMMPEWKNVRSIIKYVHLKIQGECLGRVVGGLRIQCHIDMVNSIPFKAICESTVKKTVVFTSFVQVIEKCRLELNRVGLSPEYVYADTNKNLSNIVNKFQEDNNTNPLVATYASLSTAVPLTVADAMILIDMPFRDYVLQQSVSRIHRLDADTQCYIYQVSLDTGIEPNISTRSSDILKWSQEQIEGIMNIKSPFELKDDLDQYTASLEGYTEDVVVYKSKFLSW